MALICGIDEAGRGSLAGPVAVAGCVVPEDFRLEGLQDSKKLSTSARLKLYHLIKENVNAFFVVFIGPRRIEKFNILQAVMRGVEKVVSRLQADFYIIDGNHKPDSLKNRYDVECLVDADEKLAAVSAASILAKVSRDCLMASIEKKYPSYRFSLHKGYGTAKHFEEIQRFGISTIHRSTFSPCAKLEQKLLPIDY
jgi:ribonuclease HII